MRQDQLQKARQTRWRQDGNALLTLDDAERWLAQTSLCLYLPRYQHIPAPAPSFVEAIAGRPDPTPSPEQIAAASQMLARLVASGAAIALNLFGSASGIVGEQPDFLATAEALPYLYALQPQRNPKRPPTTTGANRVSPLAVEAFQILTREGALTATELRERLGREVTEAATLRALGELWHALRVVPVPDEQGAPAHWELLTARHGRELNIGSTQSQTTALSILVSFYLQSAVAATAAEAEVFLSPLAPRSRIRDVIHGLSATRQVASFSLNGEAQLYVEGTLPEMPEQEEEIPAAAAVTARLDANLDAGLEQNEPSFPEAAARKPIIHRRSSFADRARGRFTPRDRRPAPPRDQEQRTDRTPRREGGFRPPQRRSFADRERTPRTDRGERRPFDRQDRPPRQGRPERTDQRRPQGSFEKGRSEQGPDRREPRFEKRSFNREDRFPKKRPGAPPTRREGERAPRRDGEQPRRHDGEQAGERRPSFRREGERRRFPKSAERRPSREGGEQRPFRKDRPPRPFRRDGEARPSSKGRPFRKDGEARPFSKDRPFRKDGEARPFRKDRSERPFRPERPEGKFRKDRPARPFDRDRQDRPFRKPAGERPPRREAPGRPLSRPWTERPPRSGDRERGRGFSSRPNEGERRNRPGFGRREGERPSQGERPPFRKSSEGARPGKPFNRPRNFEGGRPGNRPAGKGPFRPGKPGGKRFDNRGAGGPNRGGKRPGGSAPPRRKPGRDSGEGDEG